MSVSTRSLAAALRQIAGPDPFSDDPAALSAAAIDGISPRWLVRPAANEQVAAVLALAREEGLAVAARGSGSALALGWPPARLDVVLDLAGLNGVLEYNADDLTVMVQAGLTAGELNGRVLGPRRQWLPVDPPGWSARTLGGMVATGASGPLRTRYGTLRDLLLGVRFVQADGVVTWGGARVVKSVTGYDVPKLMVGSLGTLGVLVEFALRLHPRPDVERTWLVAFPALEALGAAVAEVLDSSLQPARLEFLDTPALQALGLDRGPLGLAVSFGSVEDAVREQGARLAELAGRFAGRLAGRLGGQVSPLGEGFWETWDGALEPGKGGVVLQVASLPSRLADTVRAIAGSAEGAGAGTVVTGNAALGVFRVLVTEAGVPATAAMIEHLRCRLLEAGGHVVVQRGPRALREQVDPWGPLDPGALALMREVKTTFDPTGVLNCGRFVGRL